MRRTLIGVSMAASLLAGCSAHRASQGPVVSPTGIVYPRGTPPVATRRSQTAVLYLRQDRLERALSLLIDGISEDPDNPVHYYLAGVTYARLQAYDEAHTMFAHAERLYPAYELQTELEREAAWGHAFNEGLDAYDAGDVERAIEVWSAATVLYDLRLDAHRNLASLLSSERRYSEAIAVYRAALEGLTKLPATRRLTPVELRARDGARVEIDRQLARMLIVTERFSEAEPLLRRLVARAPDDMRARIDLATALAGQGRVDESDAMYTTILSERGLGADDLYNLGVALFRSTSYRRAADAFRQLAELVPRSRDAWFNYANSLFAAEEWEALADAGQRLIELDPLGETSRLIVARAQLEAGDREAALLTLDGVDRAPVYLEDLQLQRAGGVTSVVGRISGNVAEPDAPIRMRFSFYDDTGTLLGTRSLTVAAPGPQDTRDLEVELATLASGYRYELVP